MECYVFVAFCFQPLKVGMDETCLKHIEYVLQHKNDKEDQMRQVFAEARHMAQNQIKELLADFRTKRSLGR